MFSSCLTLKKLLLPKDNTRVGAECFSGDSQLTEVNLGDRVRSIGEQAFYHTFVENVYIPDCCEVIDDMAFYDVETLKTVHLPAALKKLNFGVFYFCKQLDGVVIPDNVTSIGVEAFFGCKKLTHVDLPAGLTTLEREAFMSSGLKSLVLPEQISVVPEALCYGCTALSEVVLPATCTRLEESAFYGCTALRRLEVNAVTPPEVDYTTYEDEEGQSEDVISCFHDVDYANCLLVVPAGSEEAYAAHKVWGMFSQIVSDGIDGVSQSDNHAAIHAYDVLGRRLGTAARSGLQIVRQQDGSVRKVVVR